MFDIRNDFHHRDADVAARALSGRQAMAPRVSGGPRSVTLLPFFSLIDCVVFNDAQLTDEHCHFLVLCLNVVSLVYN